MLLTDRIAVVYGAAGAVGSAVARTFAREGAHVFLTGRTGSALEKLAMRITESGGSCAVAELDALDEEAVRGHADAVVRQAGRIDISFNAIGVDHRQGAPLTELSLAEFSLPISTYTATQFLTSTAAARHMKAQGSGVILPLSTTASRVAMPTDGFGPACAAVEALSRQLAGELGPFGVRVVCLRPDGIPETVEQGSHARELWSRAAAEAGMTLAQMLEGTVGVPGALLRRSPTLADVAEAAAFYASDRASGMTGVIANLTCGSLVD
ncbi:short-chain dehydrogenase [Rhizocola hellebori]|uniref:Short-chain dehydrogenase n=1 Tax=Rhizocola hellebori TaxID=1392758 RepID=A0A8J3QKY5_9ACTN|nr:SDR family oxidoreductase [Rhizocola hellebori]GIH11303.1 short-chain dehydrogenase [Rhizocola hellebori]